MSVATTSNKQGSRPISILLFFIGTCALGLSMWMNFRFGWGLSPDITDRTTLAILHVLVDPAAAGLVVAGTMMCRWGWRGPGIAFQCIAALLILYSMLSVYGFMSARIAMTQSHDSVVAMQMGRLDWAQKTMVNRELPKIERRLLRADAKELAKEIQSQLSIIPDAQAASIASAMGWSVHSVQRGLVMVSSGIAQTLKFVCLLCGVMIWPRREQASTSDKASGGGGGHKDKQDADKVVALVPAPKAALSRLSADLSSKPARMPFLEYDALLREHAMGLRPYASQQALATATGRTQQAVQQRLKKISRQLDKLSGPSITAGYAGIGGGTVHSACI